MTLLTQALTIRIEITNASSWQEYSLLPDLNVMSRFSSCVGLSSLLLGGLGGCPRGCSVRGCFNSSRLPATNVLVAMYWCARCSISRTIAGGRSISNQKNLDGLNDRVSKSGLFYTGSQERLCDRAGVGVGEAVWASAAWRYGGSASSWLSRFEATGDFVYENACLDLVREGEKSLSRDERSRVGCRGGARLDGRNPRVRFGRSTAGVVELGSGISCFGVEKEEHDRIHDTCRFKGRKQRRRLTDLDSSLYPSLVLLSLLRSGRRRAMGDETSSKFKRICVFCGSNSGNRTVFREAALDLGHELVRPR
ncbi:hypothetical protein BHE74_00015900 [Ensete ventricosum]|nr:hypothetical protein BHE74_00015900 [Ensete ventricosum]